MKKIFYIFMIMAATAALVAGCMPPSADEHPNKKPVPEEPEFIPGDVNNDGSLSIADVTTLIDYLLGSNIAINMQAADHNNDSSISIADVTALIDMLLSSN